MAAALHRVNEIACGEGKKGGREDTVPFMGGTHSIFLPNRALLRCLGGVFLPAEMEQASSGQDGGLPAAVLASVSPPSTFTPRAGREEPPQAPKAPSECFLELQHHVLADG